METDERLPVAEGEPEPAPSPTPPAAPVPDEESPDDAPPGPAPADSAPARDEQKDVPLGVQRRIDQAIARQRDAEREAEYWRSRALTPPAAPAPPVAPVLPDGPPQDDAYENHADYVAALHRYHAKAAFDAEQAARVTQQQAAIQAQQLTQQQAVIRAREAEVLQQHPDYYDRCAVVLQAIAPQLKSAIEHAGAHGPDLVLYLHDHPEDVERLNQLPWHNLGIELGMLRASASGSGTPPSREAPPPRAPTPKPEPMTPLSGGGRTTSPDTYREDMPHQVYEAWRRKTSSLYRRPAG